MVSEETARRIAAALERLAAAVESLPVQDEQCELRGGWVYPPRSSQSEESQPV